MTAQQAQRMLDARAKARLLACGWTREEVGTLESGELDAMADRAERAKRLTHQAEGPDLWPDTGCGLDR
jgi:hypothetical protein